MTAPTWPSTLPQAFNRDGYTYESGDNLLRSQPAIGPAKVRRRSTIVIDKISGTMNLDSDQLLTFKSFLSDTIADGAKPFTMFDPEGGADILVRIVAPSRRSSLAKDLWQISLQLEKLP